MSRIGKKPIVIPEKTQVSVVDNIVTVKGPLGELNFTYNNDINIKVENNEVIVEPVKKTLETKALWGTYASLIKNMIKGVNAEYKKGLIIEGVGFKADVRGTNLVLAVGFSHPVNLPIPKGIKVTTENEKISISGIDKNLVGQFAADVRAIKKPEPYLGKGIRYTDEVIRRKQGKKTA